MRTIYLLITVVICVMFFVFLNKMNKMPHRWIKQLFYVWCIFAAFYLAAIVSRVTIKKELFWIVIDGVFVFVPLLSFFLISLKKKWNIVVSKLAFIGFVQQYKWELLIVLITVCSRVWLLNSIQSWDSSEYYFAIMKACRNFNFAPSSFIQFFDLLAHPSYGYAMIMAIGEFLCPENVSGVLSVSLILTCITCVKIFHMFQVYWTHMSKCNAFLGTILCLAFPLFWGTFSCVMPDYMMLIFFILMMAYESEKKYILSLFWGICLCFSKEIGVVLAAGYYFFKLIALLINVKGTVLEKIKTVFKCPQIITGVLIGSSFVGYTLINRGLSQWKHSIYYSAPLTWVGESELAYNTFGIQKANIVLRLQEFFVIDFSWILTILFLISFYVFVLRKKWTHNKIQLHNIFPVLGEMLFYGVFMLLYITSGTHRYNVVFCIPYIIVCYVFIEAVFSKKILYSCTLIIFVLFFGQSFRSIDVITNYLYRTIDMGNVEMNCIAQEDNLYPGGDYYIYNLQHRAFDQNLEKMFKEVNLTSQDTIIMAGDSYIECVTNNTIANLNGRHMDKKWDSLNQEYKNTMDQSLGLFRVVTTNYLWGLNSIIYRDLENSEEHIRKVLDSIPGRCILYFSPIYQDSNEEIILNKLKDWFYIGERECVETSGVELSYYELYKKIEVPGLEKNSYFLNPYMNDLIVSGEYHYDEHDNYIFSVERGNTIRREGSNVEDKKVNEVFYRNLMGLVQEPISQERNLRPGDSVALTIACYDENGNYINTGYSPKGTVLVNVTLGILDIIEEVETELYKHSPGERFEVTYVFDEYNNYPEFSGKTIRFDIQINGITSELPEIDDEFIYQHKDSESIVQYKELIKESLLQAEYSEEELIDIEVKCSEIIIDQTEVDKYKKQLEKIVEEYVAAHGIETNLFIEEYMKIDKSTLEKFDTQYAEYIYKMQVIKNEMRK